MSEPAPPQSSESSDGPVPRRGEARRQAMLEAASELFLERGFEGTSVSDVVKRSGGSLATLYAWFGSKEGLFEAIAAEISAHILAALDTQEFESRPLAEALQALGERFLGQVLCPEALRWHRMCFSEGHKFPELRAALIRSGPGRITERLADYLAAQARAGRLEIEDPSLAATHFFALVKSETHLAAVCGEPIEVSPEDVVAQVRRAVRVFLRGYATPSGKLASARREPPRTRKTL